MKTLIVYTHPNPKSFNHRILCLVEETLTKKGHEVKVRDLYAEPFNPVLGATDFVSFSQGIVPPDIAQEQKLLSWAENLVFIYPIWWYERPAMLKGWIDWVLSHGFAYSYGPEGSKGLLKHKKALVIQTAGDPETELLAGKKVEVFQRPMTEGTLQFCGIQDVRARTFGSVSRANAEHYEEMLKEVSTKLLSDW